MSKAGGARRLKQTLNYLGHLATPLIVRGNDPLWRDLHFRYNQSLQEFVNASSALRTVFAP